MGAETTNDVSETKRDDNLHPGGEAAKTNDTATPPDTSERDRDVAPHEPRRSSSQIETR